MYKIKLHKKELSPLGYNMIVKGLLILFIIVGALHSASAQGIIILEQQTPSTQVMVTATEQVILKPGFHAIGSAGTFNAKIGPANSMSPIIPMAAGSTAVIQTIPIVPAAPSSDQNYIVTTTAYKAVADPAVLDDANSNTTIQYFDGLGRPVEVVQKSITPSGKDLVDITEYDGAGRAYRQWLPAAATGSAGSFVVPETFKTSLAATQYANDPNPYAETIMEGSPLSRTLGQRQPGAVWNAHPTGVSYQTNAGEVFYFYVNSSNQLQRGDNYASNTLYKTLATDEDGKTVTEYKDKLGQVVLKRSSTDVDTYYVYNDLGQLAYVLPPNFVDGMGGTTSFPDDNTLLKQFAYLYQYDERGNCIYKRLPGCEPIYMVYDKADRLVLSQDGNQRNKAQWTATKYDAFGRVIFTGTTNAILNATALSDLISTYKDKLIVESYTNGSGYACTNFCDASPLTINYFDSYDFTTFITNGSNFNWATPPTGYDAQYLDNTGKPNVKGLLTGTLVYHLNDPTKYEATALYYDDRGRVVQSRASNHLGGYDLVYNALDFTGKPNKTYKTHGINGTTVSITELYTYAYDKAQRLTATTYSLNNGSPVTLASNTYDELGRLRTKTLGGIDATTYSYNIRSWTTDIIGSRFSENLYYNVNPLSSNVCFNGNISGMQWDVPNEGIGYKRAYSFVYDGLNRLTNANYCGFNGSVVSGTTGRYNETFVFDKMGNITNFVRNGLQSNNSTMIYGKVDDLVLEHTGNQLMKVTDSGSNGSFYGDEEFMKNLTNSGNSCAYDANGNRLYDSNSNIWGIRYNILNLPDAMQFYQGHQTNYTYSATGAKLKVVDKTAPPGAELPVTSLNTVLTDPSVAMTTTTDYVGNMIYENGMLKRILTPVGYWQAGTYYYFLKDHLGSNRVVMTGSGGIAETSSYYPSGMRFGESAVKFNNSVQPYRHTGHEMQEMHGLNWIDNGARFRTVSDGDGFTGVDPLAERHYNVSPYVYCGNNPVSFIDSNGMDSTYYNSQGNTIYKCGDDPNTNATFVVKTTETTEQMYADSNPRQKGNSKPISTEDATKAENEIKNGNITGDHMKNVAEMKSQTQMEAMMSSIKDNGLGGESNKNNREYSGDFTASGVGNLKKSNVGDLSTGEYLVTQGDPDFHSHASGTARVDSEHTASWQQPPTKQDINTASRKHYEYTPGMGNGTIYIYNRTGVVATIPTLTFKK